MKSQSSLSCFWLFPYNSTARSLLFLIAQLHAAIWGDYWQGNKSNSVGLSIKKEVDIDSEAFNGTMCNVILNSLGHSALKKIKTC